MKALSSSSPNSAETESPREASHATVVVRHGEQEGALGKLEKVLARNGG